MLRILRIWLYICIAVAFFYFIIFTVLVNKQIKQCADQIALNWSIMLQQQQQLMQQLGRQIAPFALERQTDKIAQQLRIFENYCLILRNKNVVMPYSAYWVNLNQPEHIVAAFGLLSSSSLNPDRDYYTQIVLSNGNAKLSSPYNSVELNDLNIINIGSAIFDSNNNFLGQIDSKFAVQEIWESLATNLATSILVNLNYNLLAINHIDNYVFVKDNDNSKIFFHDINVLKKISLINETSYAVVVTSKFSEFLFRYFLTLIKLLFVISILFFISIYLGKRFIKSLKLPQQKRIRKLQLIVDEQKKLIQLETKAKLIQIKYNKKILHNIIDSATNIVDLLQSMSLGQRNIKFDQNINNVINFTSQDNSSLTNFSELLEDVLILNRAAAYKKQIKLNYSSMIINDLGVNINFTYNHTRIMQILSSLVYKLINDSPKNTNIKIQVEIIDSNLTIKLEDDGFQFLPQDNNNFDLCGIDLIYHNWDGVNRLLALEGGKITMEHKPYQGNIIVIIIPIAGNVIAINNISNHGNLKK